MTLANGSQTNRDHRVWKFRHTSWELLQLQAVSPDMRELGLCLPLLPVAQSAFSVSTILYFRCLSSALSTGTDECDRWSRRIPNSERQAIWHRAEPPSFRRARWIGNPASNPTPQTCTDPLEFIGNIRSGHFRRCFPSQTMRWNISSQPPGQAAIITDLCSMVYIQKSECA